MLVVYCSCVCVFVVMFSWWCFWCECFCGDVFFGLSDGGIGGFL